MVGVRADAVLGYAALGSLFRLRSDGMRR